MGALIRNGLKFLLNLTTRSLLQRSDSLTKGKKQTARESDAPKK